jgi:hypothetical protein
MCLLCHNGFHDDVLVRELRLPQNFEVWNTTSLNHLKLAALGANGYDARIEAMRVFQDLIRWRETKSFIHMPPTGLEPFPSVRDLQLQFEFIRLFRPTNDQERLVRALEIMQKKQTCRLEFSVLFILCIAVGAAIALGVQFLKDRTV